MPRSAFSLALLLLLWLGWLPAPVWANDPLLDSRGQPNALFWTLGGAMIATDQPVYDAFQKLDSPGTHRAAVAVNNLGEAKVQLGALALLTLAGNGTDRRIARNGLHGLVAGGLAVVLLKETTRRARPYADRGPDWGVRPARLDPSQDSPDDAALPPGDSPRKPDSVKSFPSGHTMAAFSLATVWGQERPRGRELAYALAALVGWARIELKQHWPSDVFFGAALGIAAGNAADRGVPFGLMFRVR